jgi:hypothetical protein
MVTIEREGRLGGGNHECTYTKPMYHTGNYGSIKDDRSSHYPMRKLKLGGKVYRLGVVPTRGTGTIRYLELYRYRRRKLSRTSPVRAFAI